MVTYSRKHRQLKLASWAGMAVACGCLLYMCSTGRIELIVVAVIGAVCSVGAELRCQELEE